jgi:hypothetical protein
MKREIPNAKPKAAIFTAEFVAAQPPELLAEILNRCWYHAIEVERLHEAAVQSAVKDFYSEALLPRKKTTIAPLLSLCGCGGSKPESAKRCERCLLKVIAAVHPL